MFPRNQELYKNSYAENYGYSTNSTNYGNGFQTERRQWNKSNPMINLEFPDPEKMMMNKKRYDEYLFKLHINNQVMKQASKKDEKEEKLNKLEGGFSIYVNGAHQKKEKYTPRHTVTKSSDNKKKFQNFNPNIHKFSESDYNELLTNRSKCAPSPVAKPIRKQWGNSSFIIKTTDGYEIKINAPNESSKQTISKSEPIGKLHKQNEMVYSYDFVSDSDTEKDDKEDLIQSVRFSDLSDSDDDDDVKNDKKMVLDLSSRDIKTLRQSINIMNLSDLKNKIDTDSEIESDLEEDKNEIKNSNKTSQFKTTFNQSIKETDESFEIEEEIQNDENETSDICDIILNKVAFLKPKDRMNLVKFLSNIETNTSKSGQNSKTKLK